MLSRAYLLSVAEQIVLYFDDRNDKARVYIAGAAVGVSHALTVRYARAAQMALITAIEHKLRRALDIEERRAREIAAGLVTLEEQGGMGTVRAFGSELVGAEDPHTATHRARSMRAVLVAELQRALSGDEPPPTVRRPAPPSSAEAR